MTIIEYDLNPTLGVGLADAVTRRIEVGEGTRDLSAYAVTERITVRRPFAGTGYHDTGEQPMVPTGAELAVAARADETARLSLLGTLTGEVVGHMPPGNPPPGGGEPPPPTPPPPVAPGWNGRVGEHRIVAPRRDRPERYVGARRHPACVARIAAARVFWSRATSVLILAVALSVLFALAGCSPPSDGAPLPDRSRVPDRGVTPVVDITPERIPTPPACGPAVGGAR